MIVATDDSRIADCVEGFGGRAVLTSPSLRSGTDRCWEAYRKCGLEADVVVNVQGDEPFISRGQLEEVKDCFKDDGVSIATLVKPFPEDAGPDVLNNPNTPKVVLDKRMDALYFSRSVIPFRRDEGRRIVYYKHIGIYAYRTGTLSQLVALPSCPLEEAESLEQLRWLWNGYAIRAAVTATDTIGIDTPADLERAERFLKSVEEV